MEAPMMDMMMGGSSSQIIDDGDENNDDDDDFVMLWKFKNNGLTANVDLNDAMFIIYNKILLIGFSIRLFFLYYFNTFE